MQSENEREGAEKRIVIFQLHNDLFPVYLLV